MRVFVHMCVFKNRKPHHSSSWLCVQLLSHLSCSPCFPPAPSHFTFISLCVSLPPLCFFASLIFYLLFFFDSFTFFLIILPSLSPFHVFPSLLSYSIPHCPGALSLSHWRMWCTCYSPTRTCIDTLSHSSHHTNMRAYSYPPYKNLFVFVILSCFENLNFRILHYILHIFFNTLPSYPVFCPSWVGVPSRSEVQACDSVWRAKLRAAVSRNWPGQWTPHLRPLNSS